MKTIIRARQPVVTRLFPHAGNKRFIVTKKPAPLPVFHAAADEYTCLVNATLDVPAPGILSNDTLDGGVDPITVELTRPINGGVLWDINDDGSFLYEAPATAGTYRFGYTLIDSEGRRSNLTACFIVVTEAT